MIIYTSRNKPAISWIFISVLSSFWVPSRNYFYFLKHIITRIVSLINASSRVPSSSSVFLSHSWYAIKLSVKWHHECLLWIHNWMRSLINIFLFIFQCCGVVMLRNVFRAGALWDTKVPHCPLFPILVYHRRVSRCYNSRWICSPVTSLVITVCFVSIVLYLGALYFKHSLIRKLPVISSLNLKRFGRYARTK